MSWRGLEAPNQARRKRTWTKQRPNTRRQDKGGTAGGKTLSLRHTRQHPIQGLYIRRRPYPFHSYVLPPFLSRRRETLIGTLGADPQTYTEVFAPFAYFVGSFRVRTPARLFGSLLYLQSASRS